MLRISVVGICLSSSACAYFHPAFVTNPSRPNGVFAEHGVVVCERHSLTRTDCAVMPQSEVNQLLAELGRRH